MVAILTLLTVLALSVLIVRVASVALMLTGVSLPLARFQARSAFTGVGYTTSESEKIVGHPVRRRIIMLLMLLGNAGIITTISAVIGGVVAVEDVTGPPLWAKVLGLLAGLAALWAVSYSKWVDRRLSRVIFGMLKRYTEIDVRDYSNLMHLSGDYGISELGVERGDYLADHALSELKLSAEGVLVLGIQRADGTFVGAPRGHTKPHAGDTLILYGRADRLRELDDRRDSIRGKIAHAEAVAEQDKRRKEEDDEEGQAGDEKHVEAEVVRGATAG